MENLGQFSLIFVSLSFPVVTVVLFLNMLTINCIYSKNPNASGVLLDKS